MKLAEYHRLPIAEKLKRQRTKMREPSVECPHCEAKLPVGELVQHIKDRCPGKRPPHPRSKWLTWSEAIAAGIPKQTMHRWVKQGKIRTRGEHQRGAKRYLARDVEKMVAARTPRPKSGT